MMPLVFKCRADNDLYRALADMGHEYPRYERLLDAVSEAPAGAGVLCLADDYPVPTEVIATETLDMARAKGLRLYIEYPASLPGIPLGEPRPAVWERAVVSGDFFSPALESGRILDLHACWFLPMEAKGDIHLAVARVAGYHKAVFGLPEETFSALTQLEDGLLLATVKLSHFRTARYAPTVAWQALWERLLGWLGGGADGPKLRWAPAVGIQATKEAPLPVTAEADAFARSVQWFRDHAVYSIDQKNGAIEGYESTIDYRGQQMPRTWPRGDCIGESTMVFALDWRLTRNPASRRLASQMLDYVCLSPDFYENDPAQPTYGLNKWSYDTPVFYGQENSSVILPALLAGRLFEDDHWDDRILQMLLANLRTTGCLGFRRDSIRPPSFGAGPDGWQVFRDEQVISYAPHYQASLWAAFLWAYALTGYEGFLGGTKNAIRMTMEAYPHKWHWTNGLSQEIARMLLPLAFLVRIEDTPEHRDWLQLMCDEMLSRMEPCGAIRETLGPPENAKYPPPRSNESYGTNEASLIQEEGDPVCDLLYTADFAFLGLHEAAAVIGDARIKEAEDRLAHFLCRLQVRSVEHPYLDGAWMRAFDYELWEYWASCQTWDGALGASSRAGPTPGSLRSWRCAYRARRSLIWPLQSGLKRGCPECWVRWGWLRGENRHAGCLISHSRGSPRVTSALDVSCYGAIRSGN